MRSTPLNGSVDPGAPDPPPVGGAPISLAFKARTRRDGDEAAQIEGMVTRLRQADALVPSLDALGEMPPQDRSPALEHPLTITPKFHTMNPLSGRKSLYDNEMCAESESSILSRSTRNLPDLAISPDDAKGSLAEPVAD